MNPRLLKVLEHGMSPINVFLNFGAAQPLLATSFKVSLLYSLCWGVQRTRFCAYVVQQVVCWPMRDARMAQPAISISKVKLSLPWLRPLHVS